MTVSTLKVDSRESKHRFNSPVPRHLQIKPQFWNPEPDHIGEMSDPGPGTAAPVAPGAWRAQICITRRLGIL